MLDYSVKYFNYTIGPKAYEDISKVCSLYGKKAVVIGGKTAMAKGLELFKDAIKDSEITIMGTFLYGNDCTYENMERLVGLCENHKPDMIFGMGGGKAIDTAKGTAKRMGIPVFTLPTIAATCAGTTSLSVVYNEDGSFNSFDFLERPAIHCFIQTEIIANAPIEYLRAGMGDTVAKHFECHLSARNDQLNHNSMMGREMSNLCYEPLLLYGEQAMNDCLNHQVTDAFQQAVLAIIVSTGLVSLLVDEDYNGAVAHSLFYGFTTIPGFEETYLHGDVVGYGVLVQLALDHKDKDLVRLRKFFKAINIPTCLDDISVENSRSYLEPILAETLKGSDMNHLPYEVTKDMIYDAIQKVEGAK